MNKIQWSPIEEFDDFDVPKAVHIMPIVMTEGFATEQEAIDFLNAVEEADFPCLIDEDGEIIATYFGHITALHCSCSPECRETTFPTYIHRMVQ